MKQKSSRLKESDHMAETREKLARPNPQGKGVVPVLDALQGQSTELPVQQPVAHTLLNYVLSRLILCAEFSFKPVRGKSYYLYVQAQRLRLSMIAPKEWRDARFGEYVGSCFLAPDMTWRVEDLQSGEALESLKAVVTLLSHDLLSDLKQTHSLDTCLPEFDARLSFHQRVLANALSRSIRLQLDDSVQLSLPDLLQAHAAELEGPMLQLLIGPSEA